MAWTFEVPSNLSILWLFKKAKEKNCYQIPLFYCSVSLVLFVCLRFSQCSALSTGTVTYIWWVVLWSDRHASVLVVVGLGLLVLVLSIICCNALDKVIQHVFQFSYLCSKNCDNLPWANKWKGLCNSFCNISISVERDIRVWNVMNLSSSKRWCLEREKERDAVKRNRFSIERVSFMICFEDICFKESGTNDLKKHMETTNHVSWAASFSI